MAKKNKEEHLNGEEGEAPEVQTSAGDDAAQKPKEPARDETPLEQAERERDEYLGNWHRARADYQNLKRRTFDDVQGAVGRERTALLQEMLTILDFLDMALATPVEHEEAKNLNHNYVGTEHLLLGLLREQEGVAAQVLMNLGLKLEDVREEVLNLLGHGLEGAETSERASGSSKSGKSKTPALDSFGRDLTELPCDARISIKKADHQLHILRLKDRSHFSTLRKKLHWG